MTCTSTLYDTAAALAVTAENLADAIDDDRPGWLALAETARDLLTALVAAKLDAATDFGAVLADIYAADDPGVIVPAAPPGPYQAVSILHQHRHHLTPDILRTIQDIWVCASAARYGAPYETGWAEDPDAYRDHDTAGCEADDCDSSGGTPCPPPVEDLRVIARRLEADLRANRRPAITDANQLDVQALCVAEEAGELVGAYRRWAGKARRTGTRRDLEDEVADVLIVTACFAERAGIDLNAAIARKLTVIYSRGWRQDDDTPQNTAGGAR